MPIPDPEYADTDTMAVDTMPASAFAFDFDLPEHLPSSPMCPANKRHRSGGTGVCVYHGRRRRSPEESTPEPSSSSPAPVLSPVVYVDHDVVGGRVPAEER